jgi:hypothetical protein
MKTKTKLGEKAIGRGALENDEGYELRESQSPYSHVFTPEKCFLKLKKHHYWQIS